jgi:hypothetical protein
MTDKPAKPDAEKLLPEDVSREFAHRASIHGSCTWPPSEAETAASLGRFASENAHTIIHALHCLAESRPLPILLQPQEQPEQDQELIAQLRRANYDPSLFREAADAIERLSRSPTSITDRDGVEAENKRLIELEAENFTLAAGQCIVDGGLIGDERGHFYCEMKRQRDEAAARIAALEAENERLGKAVCSGVLGTLLEADETAALHEFIQELRGQRKTCSGCQADLAEYRTDKGTCGWCGQDIATGKPGALVPASLSPTQDTTEPRGDGWFQDEECRRG